MKRETRLNHGRLPRLLHVSNSAHFFATAALLLLAACDPNVAEGGGTGDPPSTPIADPCGGGTRLPDIVGPATWVNMNAQNASACKFPVDKPASLPGVRIVAIDRYDETGQGQTGNFFVIDACAPPGPYGGMTVYAPSFSPPDLRLFPGDVVDFHGNLIEFPGPAGSEFPYCRTLPEVGGTLTFRFELGPNLEPHTIPLLDLKSYEGARQWLGMLVRVENVKLTADPKLSSGRYTAPIDVGGGIEQGDVPLLSNELFDMQNLGPPMAKDTTFKSVTGIITYFYGFKIAPRSADDFEI
jgi:hypothetical protein